MTQKEILYYEDAVAHEDSTIKICKNVVEKLKDEELKNFINSEIKHHQAMKDRLLTQLEECANE